MVVQTSIEVSKLNEDFLNLSSINILIYEYPYYLLALLSCHLDQREKSKVCETAIRSLDVSHSLDMTKLTKAQYDLNKVF